MTQNNKAVENDISWENRILCSDESCIGIIGADGRCRECGKAYEGNLPNNFSGLSNISDHISEEKAPELENDPLNGESLLESEENEEPSEKEDEDTGEADDLESDWEDRILCIDENCIGVIGPDGKCKECGKLYEEKEK